MKGLERKAEHYSYNEEEKTMEHIKIDKQSAIEHLLESWAAHYETMDAEYLAAQYKRYVSQDENNHLITVEITE